MMVLVVQIPKQMSSWSNFVQPADTQWNWGFEGSKDSDPVVLPLVNQILPLFLGHIHILRLIWMAGHRFHCRLVTDTFWEKHNLRLLFP